MLLPLNRKGLTTFLSKVRFLEESKAYSHTSSSEIFCNTTFLPELNFACVKLYKRAMSKFKTHIYLLGVMWKKVAHTFFEILLKDLVKRN